MPAELADAWGEFYLRYDAILWQFAGQFPLATEAADELVMQTCEQILINFPDFDLAAPGLHGWIFKIMQNKFVDSRRWQARHKEEDIDSLRGTEAEPGAWTSNPEVLLEREQERELIRNAMDELRERIPYVDWRLLKMRWLEQRKVAEIIQIAGWDPARVRNHLSRAFAKLARIVVRRSGDGL